MPQTTPPHDWTEDNLQSLQSHILAEEQAHPEATGDFSWILSAIALATKTIANKVRRARIDDVLGELGETNTHGEAQQKLDVIANDIIKACLGARANIGVLVSEEDEEPMVLRTHAEGGRYAVLFDPLDGSSNIDFSVGVGTIFSILRLEDGHAAKGVDAILHDGAQQVAAGYVLFGSSTVFVLTTGNGVDMFVLDQSIGAFVLVKSKLRIPEANRTYSINEANTKYFPQGYRNYLDWAHESTYTSRYIGSMVADVHRVLMKGGVFLYPPTENAPKGKLRLLYEANPMSFLMEQAGGKAFSGTQRTMEIEPEEIHQRTSVVMGSPSEVDRVQSFLE